jgi:DNA-binding transcriptional ArsR family regulator
VTAAILDQLAVLSDATRVRVLAVLERHELTVSELCEVLRLPQSPPEDPGRWRLGDVPA